MFSWSCGSCCTWARCLEPTSVLGTTTKRNHCSLRCGGSCRRTHLQQQLVPTAATLCSAPPHLQMLQPLHGGPAHLLSYLRPLGALCPKHPQLTLCIWIFFGLISVSEPHTLFLPPPNLHFLSLPLSAFLSSLSLGRYSIFIILHCLNIPSKTKGKKKAEIFNT